MDRDTKQTFQHADDDDVSHLAELIGEWVASPAPILIIVPNRQQGWKILKIPPSCAITMKGQLGIENRDVTLMGLIDKAGKFYSSKAKAMKEISSAMSWINDLRSNPQAESIFAKSLEAELLKVRNDRT